MGDESDLNLAQLVQEAGAEYAASLDAVHAALREVSFIASFEDAAVVVAELARRGWLLTRTDATEEAG